jgi:hypothetical protein
MTLPQSDDVTAYLVRGETARQTSYASALGAVQRQAAQLTMAASVTNTGIARVKCSHALHPIHRATICAPSSAVPAIIRKAQWCISEVLARISEAIVILAP